jgi:hypothetical protein
MQDFSKRALQWYYNVTVLRMLRTYLHLKAYKLSIIQQFEHSPHSNIWKTVLKLFSKHHALPVEVTLNRPGKTLCILLHCIGLEHCTCPLNKYIYKF